ncbi:MAG: prolipoprotein diacylglyceryl transferase family protein, partial [Candidatus Moraniibacteriota bacterium]
MSSFWQHLPETIHPIALSVGFFSLYWYALFFLGGVFVSFLCARSFARKENSFSEETIFDVFLFVFLGAIIGGRVGYVLFYNFNLFLSYPLSIISPYDFRYGVWTG